MQITPSTIRHIGRRQYRRFRWNSKHPIVHRRMPNRPISLINRTSTVKKNPQNIRTIDLTAAKSNSLLFHQRIPLTVRYTCRYSVFLIAIDLCRSAKGIEFEYLTYTRVSTWVWALIRDIGVECKQSQSSHSREDSVHLCWLISPLRQRGCHKVVPSSVYILLLWLCIVDPSTNTSSSPTSDRPAIDLCRVSKWLRRVFILEIYPRERGFY